MCHSLPQINIILVSDLNSVLPKKLVRTVT